MPISNASANWNGTLKEGRGSMKPGHAAEIPFSMGSRFEVVDSSNPEELIGAALAGCFSMALSANLERAGIKPESIRTEARVHLDKGGDGWRVSKIELTTEGRAAGADPAKFASVDDETKKTCPVGKALGGVEIALQAKLV
jgi:osmotically inducible protein OsmC